MKKILVGLFLLLGVFCIAQRKSSLIYDNNAQKRNVPSFNAIRVSNAIELFVTQSDVNEVAVSARDNDTRNHIVTEVQGGTLIIKMDNSNDWFNWKSWGDAKTKAYVSVKVLESLQGSGASNTHFVGVITGNNLMVKLSGASDLKAELEFKDVKFDLSGASNVKGSVHTNTLTIEGSGASNLELSGKAEDLSVDISGASNVKLYDLEAKGAIVKAYGASDANVNVSELLKATSSGASNINYKGAAVVKELSTSGASKVRHRN